MVGFCSSREHRSQPALCCRDAARPSRTKMKYLWVVWCGDGGDAVSHCTVAIRHPAAVNAHPVSGSTKGTRGGSQQGHCTPARTKPLQQQVWPGRLLGPGSATLWQQVRAPRATPARGLPASLHPAGAHVGTGPHCPVRRDRTPPVHAQGKDSNSTCTGTSPPGRMSGGNAKLCQEGRSSPV